MAWASMVYAQSTPKAFSYQAVISNTDGSPYASKLINFKFSIHKSGNNVYTEVHLGVNTSKLGQVNLNLGLGSVLSGNFNTIDWANGPYSVTSEVQYEGSSSYELYSITDLKSVPYANYADKAGNGINTVNFNSSNNMLTINGTYSVDLTSLKSNGASGTAGGDLSGSYPNPTIANDRITSDKIVDGTIQAKDIASGVIPTSLPISGNAGGDLSGSYPNPIIANDRITSDKIVDGTIQTKDIASGVIPTSLPISGTAGGDLSGTFPNPTIGSSKINSSKILDGSIQSIDIASGVIPTQINGDVFGPLNGNVNVNGIKGNKISNTFPGSNQILKFINNVWTPSADLGITLPHTATYANPSIFNLENTQGNIMVIKTTNPSAPSIGITSASNAILAQSSSSVNPAIWAKQNGNIACIYGEAFDGGNSSGIFGKGSASGFAGFFSGNVSVIGAVIAQAKNFKIDHPLDPANKTLTHTSIESPDMMNIYNGNVTCDQNGEAMVKLPDYFDALNKDIKYNLTCIGAFSPIYIKQKVKDNTFIIAGGIPGLEVSWQVSGVRQDAYANKFRSKVEELKKDEDKGFYICPTAFNLDESKSIYRNMAPTQTTLKSDNDN